MAARRATARLLRVGVLALGALLASSGRAQDVVRGEQLFALCSQCHGANGQGNPLALAPSIAGLEQWYVEAQLRKFRDGWRAKHFDDLGGMRMRPMAMWLKTDEDLQAAAAYVASLPPALSAPTLSGGDPARGAPLYAACSGCHGVAAEGVKDVNAPSLGRVSDWYLLTQLKNYKQGIRGYEPADVTGTAMRAMSVMLTDEQAMKDVIAHIGTLAAPAAAGSE